MNEAEFKTKLVSILNKEGGYARRIEDQYAVGVPDMNLIPIGGPVFFVEAKIIRKSTWGATPRQAEELRRIRKAADCHAYACEMGFNPDTKTITIRRIGETDAAMVIQAAIGFWTRFSVNDFLQLCHKTWSKT